MPFNPDKINIHELTIEEPEKQRSLFFDAEKEVTEQDWDKLMQDIERRKKDNNWMTFCEECAAARIISPEKAKEIELDNESWRKIEDRFILDADEKDWTPLVKRLVLAKIAFPEKFATVDLDRLDRNLWPKIKKSKKLTMGPQPLAKGMFGIIEVDPSSDPLVAVVALFPEKSSQIDRDELWPKRKESLEKFRNDEKSFAGIAASMKIIFPEKSDRLGLNEETWMKMKGELDSRRLRTDDYSLFFGYAAWLKILASEKVEFTEKGLEVTMFTEGKDLNSDIPAIPETKQF